MGSLTEGTNVEEFITIDLEATIENEITLMFVLDVKMSKGNNEKIQT